MGAIIELPADQVSWAQYDCEEDGANEANRRIRSVSFACPDCSSSTSSSLAVVVAGISVVVELL